MIDTHAHLNFEGLKENLGSVLTRALEVGVRQIINPASDYPSIASAHEISLKYPGVFAMVGIHPDHAAEITPDQRRTMQESIDQRIVAIGEVGLDYYRLEGNMDAAKNLQRELFEEMVEMAKRAGLPLVIHTREAFADTLEVLKGHSIREVVIHCFTGSKEEAEEVLDAGYMISFTGMITYPKNEALREVVRWVPLERMMVETDAPYLPPQPWRGKVCEPAYVLETAQCVSDVKKVPFEEVDRVTTANAMRFFRLPDEIITSG